MEVIYNNSFLKMYGKLPLLKQGQFKKIIAIFHQSPHDPALRNHLLKGKWHGYRSIYVSGDLRAIYFPENKFLARFCAIGTHSQLYK